MADLNEKLIFNLEVNASTFASQLKAAVDKAVKSLTPTLTVNASNIKLKGKVKALDLIDLTGFAEALKGAIQTASGNLSPTGLSGGGGKPVKPGALTALAVPGKNVVGSIDQGMQAVRETLARNISKAEVAIAKAGLKEILAAEKAAAAEIRRIKLGRMDPRPEVFGRMSEPRIGRMDPRPEMFGRMSEPGKRKDSMAEPNLSKLDAGIFKSIALISKLNTAAASSSVVFSTVGSAISNALVGKFNTATQVSLSNFKVLSREVLKFATISFGGIISGLGKVANAARVAVSPIISLGSALLRSTAILTGSGLLFGGPAFIPVATVRAASAAFDELNSFTKDVSLSVVQFSDKIASLQGADRVGFISDKFRELAASVQDTSTKFGISSKEVANGLFEILSAQVGIASTAERLEALNASARVAVGGATDVASAFKGLVAINAAFNTSFEQSSDKLFAIQRLGIAPVKELGPQLGRVASIASEAGANIDELGAAISTITARGVPLETTFTGLRQIFAELSGGGGPAIQKLVQQIRDVEGIDITFDINTLRAEGGLRSFLDKLNQIRKIDPGNIGKIFPDTRSISVILPLLSSVGRFSKDLIQIEKARGEAEAASDTIVNTLAGSYDRLRAAISNNIVAAADHIASIIGLKGIIDDIINKLNDFQLTIRNISFLDVKKFLVDLATTKEGISSVIEFITRKFGEIAGGLLKVSAPILRVVSVLGVAIGNVIGKAITGAIESSISGEGTIIGGAIDKAKGIIDYGNTQLNEGIDAVKKALLIPGGQTFNLTPKVNKQSIADTLNSSLKDAFESVGSMDSFDAGIDEVVRNLGIAGSSFSKDMLGTGKTLEQQFASLTVSINAGMISDQAKSLRNVLEQEIEGIQPFDKSSITPLIDIIQKLQSLNIAKSVLGGVDDKNINLLLDSAGKLGDARKQLKAAFISLKQDISIPDLSEISGPGNAFDKSVFDSLGIKDAGDNIRSQLVAVSNAVREFDGQVKGQVGTEELRNKFVALKNLLKFLAISNLKLDVKFDFVGTEDQARKSAGEASKFISDAMKTISSQVFDEFELPGLARLSLPKFDISKGDRDSLNRQIQQSIGNFKGVLEGIQGVQGGPFDTLRKQVEAAIKSMEGMLIVVNKIRESGSTIGDGFSEGFDQITISVASQQAALTMITDAVKQQFVDQAQASKKATDAINEQAAAVDRLKIAAESLASVTGSIGGALGGMSGGSGGTMVDARRQTINVIPGVGVGSILGGFAGNIPPK